MFSLITNVNDITRVYRVVCDNPRPVPARSDYRCSYNNSPTASEVEEVDVDPKSRFPLFFPIPLSTSFLLWWQEGIHPVTRCAKPHSWVKGIAAVRNHVRLLSLVNPY